jgi:hypothetical protein
MKLFESDKTLAFLDIQPLSRGHSVSNYIPLSPMSHHTNQRLAHNTQTPRRKTNRHSRRLPTRDLTSNQENRRSVWRRKL